MSAERGKMAAEARQCVPGTQSPLFHVPRTFFLTKWKCGTVHRAWQRTVGVLFVNKKLQLGGKIKNKCWILAFSYKNFSLSFDQKLTIKSFGLWKR